MITIRHFIDPNFGTGRLEVFFDGKMQLLTAGDTIRDEDKVVETIQRARYTGFIRRDRVQDHIRAARIYGDSIFS